MPKTIFKVTDRTGLNAAWEESHVVYIPVASKYTASATPKQVAVEPTLYTNKALLEADKEKFDAANDEGYKAAIYLLEIGLPVLVEGVLTTNNGNAPDADTDPGTIEDPDPNQLEAPGKPVFDWDRLKDKNLYDIRFITTGRWDAIYAEGVPTPDAYDTNDNYAVGDYVSNTVSSTTTYYVCIKAVDNSGETKVSITDTEYWTSLGTTWNIEASNVDILKDIIDLANYRKDCTAIINFPKDIKKASDFRELIDSIYSSTGYIDGDGQDKLARG